MKMKEKILTILVCLMVLSGIASAVPLSCIDITKTVEPTTSKVGDWVEYTISVMNCGDSDLENIIVEDPQLGGVLAIFPNMEPGLTLIFTVYYQVKPEDAPGPLVNCATASAVGANDIDVDNGGIEVDNGGIEVSDEDCIGLDLVNPAICIEKTVDNESPCVGDTVIYTICIENCGDWDLENVEVTDPDLGGVLARFPDQLAFGAVACVDIPYVVQLEDECPLINTATVTATAVDLGNPFEDSNDAEICPKPCGELVFVDIDIKPTSCPNPLNTKSKGVLPAAILGSVDMDVLEIDPASIRVKSSSVAPIRSNYEDVATPVSDPCECDCTTEGPDGFLDLTLKFKTQDIVEALGEVIDGELLILSLTGVLFDGTPIEGTDCIIIHGKHKPHNKADINKDGVVDFADFAIMSDNWLQSIVEAEKPKKEKPKKK
jgi:hypothetical protein